MACPIHTDKKSAGSPFQTHVTSLIIDHSKESSKELFNLPKQGIAEGPFLCRCFNYFRSGPGIRDDPKKRIKEKGPQNVSDLSAQSADLPE